jgi:hypothetical protein
MFEGQKREPTVTEPRCDTKTNATSHPRRTPAAWFVALAAAALSTLGLIGGLCLFWADDLAAGAVSVVAVLALAALAAMTWHASRARADRRWRAALDRYAERELANMNHTCAAARDRNTLA